MPARTKIKEILGDFVKDNENEFQQDLIITDPECRYKYLEIQVCAGWLNGPYPYETLTIYERKQHYGLDTLFMTLNKNLTHCYIFDRKSFSDTKLHRLKKYSREYVYDVPWSKALKIDLECLDAFTINLY